jgi:hypothetical protein
MVDKIKVILRDDTIVTLQEWQKIYGLNACANQIGKFFFADEYIFARDLREYGQLIVSELLIRVLDDFRTRAGRPIHVNSFNRDLAKQAKLRAEGLRAASVSPHVVCLAADIDTTSKDETLKFVPILLQSAKELGIKIRVGYMDYMKPSKAAPNGQTFIHVDVCPEYYAQGKPRHSHTHPAAWEVNYLTW